MMSDPSSFNPNLGMMGQRPMAVNTQHSIGMVGGGNQENQANGMPSSNAGLISLIGTHVIAQHMSALTNDPFTTNPQQRAFYQQLFIQLVCFICLLKY